MPCNSVSTLKLLMSNFLCSHINYGIYFSDRMKFYRLVKSFNGSINIRMQRHKKDFMAFFVNCSQFDRSIHNKPKDQGYFWGKRTSQRERDLGTGCAYFLAEGDSSPAPWSQCHQLQEGSCFCTYSVINACSLLWAHASAITLGRCLLC